YDLLYREYTIWLYIIINSFFFSSRRRHTRCYRDWSSDVCSSDLLEVHVARAGRHRNFVRVPGSDELLHELDDLRDVLAHLRLEQIGRASCRERVYISGGAGSVKQRTVQTANYTSSNWEQCKKLDN